jgi:hypothetical protein
MVNRTKVLRCGCGREYSLDAFRALPFSYLTIDDPIPGLAVEFRDCVCKSTRGVVTSREGDAVTDDGALIETGPWDHFIDVAGARANLRVRSSGYAFNERRLTLAEQAKAWRAGK